MAVRKRVRGTTLLVTSALAGAVLVALGPVGTASGSVAASTVRSSAAVTTTPPYCGPSTLLKADGTRWKCTFADYFGGTVLKADKWTVLTSQTADWGTNRA